MSRGRHRASRTGNATAAKRISTTHVLKSAKMIVTPMASRLPSETDIKHFWEWFESAAARISDSLASGDEPDGLAAQVEALGVPGWELGGGADGEAVLALSPEGDPDVWTLTQRIVAFAPHLPGWSFLAARPCKPGVFEFSLSTNDGEYGIDARPWNYVLFRYPDSMFDIVVEQTNLSSISAENRECAAWMVLDSILGEEQSMLTFSGVEAVESLPADVAPRRSPIACLKQHLAVLDTEVPENGDRG